MSSPPIWRELSQRSHFSKPSSQWIAKWSVSCKMCNPPPSPHRSPPPALPCARPQPPLPPLGTKRTHLHSCKMFPARIPSDPHTGAATPGLLGCLPGHRLSEARGDTRGGAAPPARPPIAAGLVRRTRPRRLSRLRRLPTLSSRGRVAGLRGREGDEVRGPIPSGPPSPGPPLPKQESPGAGSRGRGRTRAPAAGRGWRDPSGTFEKFGKV